MASDPMGLHPDQVEFSLYAALKLFVYERLLGEPSTQPFGDSILASLPPFTVRRVHRLVSAKGRQGPGLKNQLTDLFWASPYFIRERLRSLNHGTVLLESGRGLRRALTYRWNERPSDAAVDSFRRLRSIVGTNLSQAADIYRLGDRYGDTPFRVEDFVLLFKKSGERSVPRKWYESSAGPSGLLQFRDFLSARMDALVHAGLLLRRGQVLQLSAKGLEAAHYFELFIYSAVYPVKSAT